MSLALVVHRYSISMSVYFRLKERSAIVVASPLVFHKGYSSLLFISTLNQYVNIVCIYIYIYIVYAYAIYIYIHIYIYTHIYIYIYVWCYSSLLIISTLNK